MDTVCRRGFHLEVNLEDWDHSGCSWPACSQPWAGHGAPSAGGSGRVMYQEEARAPRLYTTKVSFAVPNECHLLFKIPVWQGLFDVQHLSCVELSTIEVPHPAGSDSDAY